MCCPSGEAAIVSPYVSMASSTVISPDFTFWANSIAAARACATSAACWTFGRSSTAVLASCGEVRTMSSMDSPGAVTMAPRSIGARRG
jgi:hypothetical protein